MARPPRDVATWPLLLILDKWIASLNGYTKQTLVIISPGNTSNIVYFLWTPQLQKGPKAGNLSSYPWLFLFSKNSANDVQDFLETTVFFPLETVGGTLDLCIASQFLVINPDLCTSGQPCTLHGKSGTCLYSEFLEAIEKSSAVPGIRMRKVESVLINTCRRLCWCK